MRAGARVGAALATLALVGGLAACGDQTATSDGAATVTSVDTPLTSRTLSQSEVDAVLTAGKPAFRKAAKAFRSCDEDETADTYRAYPCLKKAAAVTTVANGLLAQVVTTQVPPTAATTVADLKRMSAAGKAVAAKCRKVNDQTCDQALARFRADQQSLLWDLQIDL